jgi:hypothetical protein
MVGRERPFALFAPSVRSIKVYRGGRIDYQGKSGSVSIAAPLPVNGFQAHTRAREFAAMINGLAMELAESTPAPTTPSPPSPPWKADLLDQLERLGRLRDSGVLTEDEFQAQKAALLRPAPEPEL